jgi:hypothetical protein
MEIILLIIGIFLHFFAVPVLIGALIWFFLVGRRLYKEKKSLDAFQGNELAKSMTKDRIKAQFLSALGIVLWPVIFLGLTFLLAEPLGTAGGYIALAVASVVTFIFQAKASGLKKRYNTNFKENMVKAELAKAFDNLSFEPEGKFEADSIFKLKFFRDTEDELTFSGNDLITADYQGLPFAQCDMQMKEWYTVTVRDKDGDTRTEQRSRSVFKGRGMRFDFAEAFRGRVQVVSKDFTGASVKETHNDWQTVETELAEFGEHFEVYALDQLDAMAVLTPQMIEGIFYLRKALNVPISLYFTDKSMFVFMALDRDAFDVSSTKTLLEETKYLERDIALMRGFMDVMYFKRPATADAESPENNRAETAAAVAAATAATVGEKAARGVAQGAKLGVGLFVTWVPRLMIAVYVISAIYALFNLPDGVASGFTWGDELTASSDADRLPTIGFVLVAGIFIVPSALGRNFFFSGICLALYLAFMSASL